MRDCHTLKVYIYIYIYIGYQHIRGESKGREKRGEKKDNPGASEEEIRLFSSYGT